MVIKIITKMSFILKSFIGTLIILSLLILLGFLKIDEKSNNLPKELRQIGNTPKGIIPNDNDKLKIEKLTKKYDKGLIEPNEVFEYIDMLNKYGDKEIKDIKNNLPYKLNENLKTK